MSKNKFKNGLITFGLAIVSFIIVAGCEKKDEENWIISSEKCVFIDHRINTNGVLLEGDYHGGLRIDFPTYRFDKASRKLSGEFDFAVNKSLKIIYGYGASLSGVVGSGVSSALFGIYDLPFKKGKFEIKEIESDGTVHIQYKDSLIVLKSSEEWIDITSEIYTQESDKGIAKAAITITDKIVNCGLIEKSEIEIE